MYNALSKHIVPSALARTKACPASPGIITEHQIIGTADLAGKVAHEVAAAHVRHHIEPGFGEAELDALYNQIGILEQKVLGRQAHHAIQAGIECADYVIQAYDAMGHDTVVSIETPIDLPTRPGDTISCRPDFVLIKGTTAQIIDFKYRQKNHDQNHENQLNAYALAVCYQHPEIKRVHLTAFTNRFAHGIHDRNMTSGAIYEWATRSFGPAITAALADDAKA